MPDSHSLLSFLGISIILTIAPGPDNLMVLAHSLSRGPRAGLALALGCTAGCLTHILWATLGLSAALAASPRAFFVLKLAGAAYLLWLGWQALRADPAAPPTPIAEHRRPADRRDLLRGFVANAINPKVALFFLAFLPQFVVPAAGHPALQMLMLGLIFMAQTIVIFGAIALMAGRLGALLRRHPRLTPWLDRLAGLTFFTLAIRLLTAPPLR